jgi:hypothetical protein
MLTINSPTTDNNRLRRDRRSDLEENSDLLERAKLGDVNAFGRLVGQYEKGIVPGYIEDHETSRRR